MRKKILKILDKKLSIDYVNDFLRRKGIATDKYDEGMISFKLYGYDWIIIYECEYGKIFMRIRFTINDDDQIDKLMKAANKVNCEHYAVKVYLDEFVPQDEAVNPIKDAKTYTLVFSFEHFCFTESAFDRLYEYAIYAMIETIDYCKKKYNEYKTEYITPDHLPTIGFHSAAEQSDATSVTADKHKQKQIGFI